MKKLTTVELHETILYLESISVDSSDFTIDDFLMVRCTFSFSLWKLHLEWSKFIKILKKELF